MKVLITRTTMADGRKVREGSIEDLPDRDAAILIELGKAVAAGQPVLTEPEPVKRKGRKRAAE